jgi:hypothetical protein
MNKHRVLSAMLNLGEFTASDLARFSGVKLDTVRTIMVRQESNLEQVRVQETGSRGGQFKVYRIRPSRVEDIQALVTTAYANLTPGTTKTVVIPISLRAVEDTLTRRWLDSKNDVVKRAELFSIAEIRLESARYDIDLLLRQAPAESAPHLRLRLQSAEMLLDLCANELAAENGTRRIPSQEVYATLLKFKDVAEKLRSEGDANEAVTYLSRAVGSPLLTHAGSG